MPPQTEHDDPEDRTTYVSDLNEQTAVDTPDEATQPADEATALRTVSPNLAARMDAYRGMGGRSFLMTIDALSFERALESSRTRRAMYEAGTYTPRSYGLIVHRRDALRWATQRGIRG